MFKTHSVHQIFLLAFSLIGITLVTGCASSQMNSGTNYIYHARNGQEYYQASNGVYYYEGEDGHYYYGHRYYPDSNNQLVNNSRLSVRVRAYLLQDPFLRNQIITVKTDDGRVELLGTVDTLGQKRRAVEVVRSVPGVTFIDDDLVVKSQEL